MVKIGLLLVIWVILADERYAYLIRQEEACLARLVEKYNLEHPAELTGVGAYLRNECSVPYRTWGFLEKALVLPALMARKI